LGGGFGEPSTAERQAELIDTRFDQTTYAQSDQAQGPVHEFLPRS
jgi:hypothetical protein